MKKPEFIRKPFLTLAVVVLVAAAIFYIESQKPKIDINKNIEENNPNSAYPRAPDFAGIEKWINSEPLKIEQLRGKVVLVDFWTYTCINCIRTLPYLKDWDKKYRDEGLVIVGVHTPEFEFEKKYENVLKAVNDYQLKYAVAQDNNYVTWNLYQNRYWPHKFLIDIDGYVRYDHIGEGAYEETEMIIQELLKERMERLNKKDGIKAEPSKPKEAMDVNFSGVKTPEIYFGYQFDRGNLGYENIPPDATVDFRIPTKAFKNFVYLSGKWKYNADNMELISDDGEIFLIFEARKVNIVAGSENASDVNVYLDNEKLNAGNKGDYIILKDNSSMAKANEFKLYNVVSAEDYGTHAISMVVEGRGFRIYTFTFG